MSESTRRDVEAALAARSELGAGYDDHIAAGLAERVEQLAALRAGELRHENELALQERQAEASARTQSFVIGLVSLGAGIPITAIAGAMTDLPGMVVVWAGIVGVNLAHARTRLHRR